MAITVDSSQWIGQRDDTPLAVPVVWGEFWSEAARDHAMARRVFVRDMRGLTFRTIQA